MCCAWFNSEVSDRPDYGIVTPGLHPEFSMNETRTRCRWCGDDPLYRRYHDEEWGVQGKTF
jgi:hypothetical protein